MNNFVKRTISGGIFVAITIASILLSPYTFAAVFALFTAMAAFEFHKLTNKPAEVQVNKTVAVIGAVLLFLCSFLSWGIDTNQKIYKTSLCLKRGTPSRISIMPYVLRPMRGRETEPGLNRCSPSSTS